jgi:serine protease Do
MKNWLPFTLRRLGASFVILATVFAQPAAKTPAEILQENTAALALILSDGNSTVSLGSGFFIQGGSALVTNFHVIEGAKAVYVKAGDGWTFSVDTVYGYDVEQDLAVLKVPAGTTRTVALGDSDKVVTGTSITVIGNPEGFDSQLRMV